MKTLKLKIAAVATTNSGAIIIMAQGEEMLKGEYAGQRALYKKVITYKRASGLARQLGLTRVSDLVGKAAIGFPYDLWDMDLRDILVDPIGNDITLKKQNAPYFLWNIIDKMETTCLTWDLQKINKNKGKW